MTHDVPLAAIADLNGRYDLYGAVHKGLRKAGCDMLIRLGSADFAHDQEAASVLESLRLFLMLAAAHVVHEDDNIHGPLQQRGVSTETVDHQHDDHRAAFDQLAALADEVEKAWPLHKAAAGRRLYLAFAAYLAEDLAHMHEEECVTAPLLWKNFTDDELIGIEMRIIASLPPEKNMAFMRMMIPAMNPAERTAMLDAMRRGAPPEIFQAVIEFAVRPSLTQKAFDDLADRLQLAA